MSTAHQHLDRFADNLGLKARGLRFALVISRWNSEITESMYKACFSSLVKAGAEVQDIQRTEVPGSFELVYACRQLAVQRKFDAVVAIGSVIRGETPHFDFVCGAVSQGIKDINLLGESPVIFCVLTDDNLQQSLDRSGGKHGNKGHEAAAAAVEMALLKRSI